jgi:hypothetical protein
MRDMSAAHAALAMALLLLAGGPVQAIPVRLDFGGTLTEVRDFGDFHVWGEITELSASVVPEPGTLILLGIGLFGLHRLRKAGALIR